MIEFYPNLFFNNYMGSIWVGYCEMVFTEHQAYEHQLKLLCGPGFVFDAASWR